MGDEIEDIEDQEDVIRIKRQARIVHVKAFLVALAIAALSLFVPEVL